VAYTEAKTKHSGIYKRSYDTGRVKYRVRYRPNPNTAPISRAFDALEMALAFQVETRSAILAGTYIDPADRAMTMAAWVPAFRATRRWNGDTDERRQGIIDNWVLPTFGTMQLGRIRQADVQSWVNVCEAKGLAPATVGTQYEVLVSILRSAVKNKRLADLSCLDDIELPETDRRVRHVLEPHHVLAVADSLAERYRIVVWLGAMAGLRLGETMGLTPDHIDYEAKTITVVRQWKDRGGFSPPKTKSSKRELPVGDALLSKLRAHIDTFGLSAAGTLVHAHSAQAKPRPPMRRASFYNNAWSKAVRKLELPPGCYSPHALRHHYASALIASGVHDAKVIMARMGHTSISMTYDIYGHLFPGSHDDATRGVFDGDAYRTVPALRVVA
jgi:integrase